MKYRDEQTNETICRLSFKIPESIEPPVFMYYRLTNFYQNHRRYVKSLDIDQLKGKPVDNKTIDGGSCDPLKLDDSGKAYYPCGLIANSMFNDTIKSPELLNDGNDDDPVVYVMTNKGIAWDSDKQLIKTTQYKPGQVVPPPNWQARYPHNYTTEIPDLHDNEEFMVWMRTAALPNFSKLSRRNDTTAMSPGTYQLDIADRKIRPLRSIRSVLTFVQTFPLQSTGEQSQYSYLLGPLSVGRTLLWVLRMWLLAVYASFLVRFSPSLT